MQENAIHPLIGAIASFVPRGRSFVPHIAHCDPAFQPDGAPVQRLQSGPSRTIPLAEPTL
jgi:hypothetical protein